LPKKPDTFRTHHTPNSNESKERGVYLSTFTFKGTRSQRHFSDHTQTTKRSKSIAKNADETIAEGQVCHVIRTLIIYYDLLRNARDTFSSPSLLIFQFILPLHRFPLLLRLISTKRKDYISLSSHYLFIHSFSQYSFCYLAYYLSCH